MAGGGIKKGFSYGETDEIGYSAVSGKVEPFDIQATILNQLGFDHEKFTYEFQGRPFRLTDAKGKVIEEILNLMEPEHFHHIIKTQIESAEIFYKHPHLQQRHSSFILDTIASSNQPKINYEQ